MNDGIIKATASGRGVNIIPNVGVGAIDMQVALFETQKSVTIKLLRRSVATRRPPVVFYSIYGTRGTIETGRDGAEDKLYIEGEKGYEKGMRAIKYLSYPKRLREATEVVNITWCMIL